MLARRLGTALALAAALGAPAMASAQVQPYGTNDFRGFRNVLPPGTNGLVNPTQLFAYEATHARPPHNNDQVAMYSNLTEAAPNIQAAQISQFYKDATFGVLPANVDQARTETPEPGATIIRDKQFGVPHIYGDTRPELMYGIGYATAEDRLFFIDVLRHAGQGDLASFAGGANVAMDESVWASTPYNGSDLTHQVQVGLARVTDGPQILADITNYVAGINAYIMAAKLNPTLMPGEYAAIGQPGGPQLFRPEDLISIASLVGGIFGQGGGGQLNNAILYEQLLKRFGREHYVVAGSPEGVPAARGSAATAAAISATATTPASVPATIARSKAKARRPETKRKTKSAPRPIHDNSGFGTFLSFVDPSDPEAPTTVRGKSFPYETLPLPRKTARGSVALPDPGSVQFAKVVAGGAAPTGTAADAARKPPANAGLLSFPRGMSNALLISAAHSASGHPIAVMGPQVAYFAPEILMEEDIHGPGIDADGAAFPGVNLYVELGHGRDYAWSATSSGQGIIDTFAVPLCHPGGGAVATSSDFYVLHGRCVQMETLTRQESWLPNAADMTPPGSITLQTKRTAFGVVIGRATVHGKPVAYTNLRSTYQHELDSAVGFEQFNNPAKMRSPRDFFNAAYKIGFTFNWFYVDDRHIAYFNSGLNPVRAPNTNPLFPVWSSLTWRGYDPTTLTEQQTPQRAHPQAIDQKYLTSWNNKQAPGYNDANTSQQFSSIYRSQLLDNNIEHYLAGGRHKLTLVDLINAMGNAGTQDLRGVEVLPYALKLIGHPNDPTIANALAELRTWVATGSHRINRAHPGTSGDYDQATAIRIMDAWWPLLIRAELQPALGSSLLSSIESEFPINDQPGHGTSGEHLGSAWDVGFYGIVQKDLRAALHQRVAGPLNRVYCGKGSVAACRAALVSSLRQAIAQPAAQIYPADGVCSAGDQECSDSIQFRAIGAVTQPLMPWVNRPTFQQVVELLAHGPR